MIYGIILFDNKEKFSPNNRNIPTYLFIGLNKEKFIVSSNLKTKINQLVSIKYLKEEREIPRGEIVEYFGDYNDYKVNLRFYLNYYGLRRKNHLLKDYQIPIYNNEYIDSFSIDPIGCKDIDDSFSINENYIGVHISDISSYIFEKDYMDIINRVSTIYLDKNINMIDKRLSEGIASLLDNQITPVISFYFDIINFELKFIKKEYVKNKTFNYQDNNELINKLKEISKINDTHNLVEYWMIKVNSETPKLVDGLINRYSIEKEKMKIDINVEELKFLEWSKSEYGFYNESQYHEQLNLKYYAHLTSPLRRSIDFINHLILRKNYFKEEINLDWLNNDIINLVNEEMNKLNKFKMEKNRLEIFYKLPIEIIYLDGYILEDKIYLPELKRFIFNFNNNININNNNNINNIKIKISILKKKSYRFYKEGLIFNIINDN